MSEHADRAALLIKLALRQAMRRINEEAEVLSQYETLAGNLGWEELAESVAGVVRALGEASERTADAVEEAVRLQAESLVAHAHEHQHIHTHPHQHPHDHEHG
jgi:hypothetical protein